MKQKGRLREENERGNENEHGCIELGLKSTEAEKSSSRKQIKERLTALQELRNGEFNRPNEQEQTTNEPITDF